MRQPTNAPLAVRRFPVPLCGSRRSTPLIRAAGAAVVLSLLPAAFAADTWDGGDGSNANWTTDTNWADDSKPVPGASEALTFDGVTNLTTTNDFDANSQFNAITFAAGAGAFSLGGNAINLGDGVTGVKIVNSSANLQTIGLGVNLQQANTGINGGTAGVQFTGNLTGTGGISISGAGGVILSGSNNYSGNTTVLNTTFLRFVATEQNTVNGVTSVMSPNSLLVMGPMPTATPLPVLQLRANSSTTFTPATLSLSSTSSQPRTFEINVGNNGSGTNQWLHIAPTLSSSNMGTGANATTLKVTGSNGYGLSIGALTLSSDGILSIDASAPVRIGVVNNGSSSPTLRFVGTANAVVGDINRLQGSRNITVIQAGSGSLTLEGEAPAIGANVNGGYFFSATSGQLNLNHANAIGLGNNSSSASANRILTLGQGVTLDNTSGAPITILNGNTTIAGTTSVNANLNVFHVIFNGDVTWAGSDALQFNAGSSSGQGTMKGAFLLGSDNTAATRTITTNGTAPLMLNAAIHDGTAGGNNLVKAGTGTLVLSGINQYSGNTTVTAGTLVVNGGAVASQTMEGGTTAAGTGSNNRITVSSTAGLVVGQAVTGTNIAAGTYIVNVGTGQVFTNKAGLATATGTVTFGDGSATGRGSVAVTGGRLLGAGTIRPIGANTFSVGSGGRLGAGSTASGPSLAKLTLDLGATTGGASFASGSAMEFELGTAAATIEAVAPGDSDQIAVTNASAADVVFGGTVIDLMGTGNSDGFYKLFDTDGGVATWSGLGLTGQQITSGLTLANAGYGTGVLLLGDGTNGEAGDIYLQMTGTPEPASMGLLLTGAAALLRRRRRSS